MKALEQCSCHSILLINHGYHVHFSLPPECWNEFLLITSMSCFVFTVTGRPSPSLNQYGLIMPFPTQCKPNSHYFYANWVILMFVKLSLTPKVHILFIHVNTKVQIHLVTKRMKSRSVPWDKRLVDFLRDCFKHCFIGCV